MPQDLISQFDRKYALPIETYRQVLNLSLRNSIPDSIRWEGMMCYVVSEGKSYVLTGGLTDSDWVEFGTLVNVNVVDNLASTSATDALSANQGRVLDETKLSDAPSDGSTYGRKDGAWEVVSGGGAVDSVFGRTGAVTAQTGDYTFAQIGSTPTTLSGYGITDGVPTSRTLTAGNGLTGGGDLSANRTLTLGTPGSTTLSSTNAVTTSSHTHAFAPGGTTSQYIRGDGSLATYAGGVTSVFGRTGAVVAANGDYTFAQIGSTPTTLSGYGITDGVPTSRTLTAGNGITGGGDLSANRTFTLGTPGSTTLSSTNAVTASSHTHAFAPGGTTAQYIRGDGSLATFPSVTGAAWGSITGTLSSQTDLQSALDGKVPTSRTITTGNHLSGGGALSANRTLTLTPTTGQWIADNQSNNRIWLGSASSVTNGILLQASVNGQQLQYRDVSSDIKWRVNTSGNSVQSGTATATNFILSSDRRLKENIREYSPKPLDLKYRTWEWKKDGSPGKGFIAQEVQKTNPEYVVEGNDGMLAVDYIGILIAKVAELESDIAKIKKQI